jgi:hypothetical protein
MGAERWTGENLMVGSPCRGGASKQWVSALLLLALCRTPRGTHQYRCRAWLARANIAGAAAALGKARRDSQPEVGRHRDGQHISAPTRTAHFISQRLF